jgi:DNA-directed RNA polymerase subunit H (RpoH/RPB5)
VTLTKQKASEIFYNKAVNEDKIMMQMKMDMEQAQILEELRLRNMQLKAIQRNDFFKKLSKMKDEVRINAE